MKVVIINSFYFPNILGGAEISVQHLAEGLLLEGHNVVVICLGTESSVSDVNGVKVYCVPLFNVYFPFIKRPSLLARILWNILDIYNPIMARRVGKILDSEQPDVVHTNILLGFSCAVWRTIRKRNIRLIHTIRDHVLLCPRSTMFKNGRNCPKQCFSCKLFSFTRKAMGSHVEHVVGISKYILNRHMSEGWFKNAKNSVIFNSFRRVGNSNRVTVNDMLRFGYIGRVTAGKGIEVLLRAFLSLDNRANVELVVAGTGEDEYLDQMKTMACNANVRFLGFVPREEFYGQVDVIIMPSLVQEALGRAVLEAYAHGVPVIASRRGGIPEIVESGRTGFLFDPDSPGELQRYMELVLQDSSVVESMSRACTSKSEEFREEVIAGKYLEVYEDDRRSSGISLHLNLGRKDVSKRRNTL